MSKHLVKTTAVALAISFISTAAMAGGHCAAPSASTDITTPESTGDRPSNPNLAILTTDGRATSDDVQNDMPLASAPEETQGAGDRMDKDNLAIVATDGRSTNDKSEDECR